MHPQSRRVVRVKAEDARLVAATAGTAARDLASATLRQLAAALAARRPAASAPRRARARARVRALTCCHCLDSLGVDGYRASLRWGTR